MILTDIFPRPKRIEVIGCKAVVPVLCLGDLADLQDWVNENSWNPWDVPERDDPCERWALAFAKSEHWPPVAWSALAREATDHAAFVAYFLWMAIGRHNGFDVENCMKLQAVMSDYEFDMIYACAYDIHPNTIAHRHLNRIEGREPPDQAVINWNEDIYRVLQNYPGLDPMSLERMSISFFRFLSLQGNDVPQDRLPPLPGVPYKESRRARKERVDWARDFLAKYYSSN